MNFKKLYKRKKQKIFNLHRKSLCCGEAIEHQLWTLRNFGTSLRSLSAEGRQQNGKGLMVKTPVSITALECRKQANFPEWHYDYSCVPWYWQNVRKRNPQLRLQLDYYRMVKCAEPTSCSHVVPDIYLFTSMNSAAWTPHSVIKKAAAKHCK